MRDEKIVNEKLDTVTEDAVSERLKKQFKGINRVTQYIEVLKRVLAAKSDSYKLRAEDDEQPVLYLQYDDGAGVIDEITLPSELIPAALYALADLLNSRANSELRELSILADYEVLEVVE